MSQPTHYIFDAYGTLLDLSAAARKCLKGVEGADPKLLAEIWRGRQLEYAWTETALGLPTRFWDVTTRALDVALHLTGLAGDAGLRRALLEAYAELDAYEDALPALEAIKAKGATSVIYSNANPDMLDRSVAAAGLDRALDGSISVDGGGVYKPNQAAYSHIRDYLGIDPAQAIFVSSNPWDAAGAAKAGFLGVWVNRLGHSYPFPDVPLHAELTSLIALERL
ncbi:MAG: haloacid dehalogenase type II [Magnetovibrionaceae bacterium]